ncbi:MAG: metal-sensitive transcriptional regulator [Candidatus Omnitrophota bacterium]|nr:metal-sensitive transcriptional regulator [Candidatus Omnitrophota bacterium]MDP3786802.1 metal-sensitive transcriptional regulator [Candidatus Omnitrophota bacterium]
MVYSFDIKGEDKMNQMTTHEEQLVFLRKIEGQIRGIQRMIEEKRYCVDIITQLHSIIGALYRVEEEVFKKHIDGCMVNALKGKSETEKQKKITEIVDLVSRFRKSA